MEFADARFEAVAQHWRLGKRAIGPEALGRIEKPDGIEKRSGEIIALRQGFADCTRNNRAVRCNRSFEAPSKQVIEFLLRPAALIGTHLSPAEAEQYRYVVVIVVGHTLVIEPAIGVAIVANAQEGVDQLWPMIDSALEIARHVKCQAEVDGPPALPLDDVIRAEESGGTVLPTVNEAFDDGRKTGIPRITARTAAQDQPNEIRRGEIQFLAAVDAILGETRD